MATGSITLCHSLIEARLVSQHRLFTYPVVRSRGRRLFPDGFEAPELQLLDAITFRCGITARLRPSLTPSDHASRATIRRWV